MNANKPGVFVALDGLVSDEFRTMKIAEKLVEGVQGNFGFKFNLDFALEHGVRNAVEILSTFKVDLFADLKMWNGSRTMEEIVSRFVDRGVQYVNAYALAEKELPLAVKATAGTKTNLLGLTVLSHYDDAYCLRHFKRSLTQAVKHFADIAVDAGCHGIIVPGTCLHTVCDLNTVRVATGIRPLWYKDDRHKQEVAPQIGVAGGANFLVCGSPIMKANDPVAALQKILDEIA